MPALRNFLIARVPRRALVISLLVGLSLYVSFALSAPGRQPAAGDLSERSRTVAALDVINLAVVASRDLWRGTKDFAWLADDRRFDSR